MDEELIGSFKEPCSKCSSVTWGVSEEGMYYCKSCHNVIERTVEVVDESCVINSRASWISKGSKKKRKLEDGKTWMVCEGFQFILKHQAEALLEIGICPQFKDEVLWNFWKRYLQKTQQAYTTKPVRLPRFQLGSESESATESLCLSNLSQGSGTELDSEPDSGPAYSSGLSSDGWDTSSQCSGSLDASSYCSPRVRRTLQLISMPMTLAFIYLSLLWAREAISLADLLRFTTEGHIPYINAYQRFPEEMKLYGKDLRIFRTESIPSYKRVKQEAHKLAVLLELPQFPPLTHDCLLHPSLLCLRYLTDANLPDELHGWTYSVMEQAGVGEEAFLTYNPMAHKARLLNYDLMGAALIIVSLKLLFKLDDDMEWLLSRRADENKQNKDNRTFCMWKWYKTVQRALHLAKEKEEQAMARLSWKPQKPLYSSRKDKSVVLKRRRMVEQLQTHFQKLAGSEHSPQRDPPCSFRFRWGPAGRDGPSYHNHHLGCAVKEQRSSLQPFNRRYWHTSLKSCHPRHCGDHFRDIEATLPRSYTWVLDLFSFLLRVKVHLLHAEVCQLEQRLFKRRCKLKARQQRHWTRKKGGGGKTGD